MSRIRLVHYFTLKDRNVKRAINGPKTQSPDCIPKYFLIQCSVGYFTHFAQKGHSAMKPFEKLLFPLTAVCTLPLALSLLVSAVAAPQEQLSQEQLEAIAIQPANHWRDTQRVAPEMLPLFKEESITIGDNTVKYRLHVPENMEPDKKYPLLLWLHGIGEVGTDNTLQLVHLHHIITYLTGENKRDFFLLVPQHVSGEHWARADQSTQTTFAHVPAHIKDDEEALKTYKTNLIEQIKASAPDNAEVTVEERRHTTTIQRRQGGVFGIGASVVSEEREELLLFITIKTGDVDYNHPLERAYAMIDQISENYPVDRNRITVSGLSSGGDGTWRALERRPDLFAAAVPLVSWTALTDEAMEKSPILKKIPIWAIYSSDDRSIDYARAQFERAEKSGANVKKTEFGICGHNAWTPAMLQADIFAWLLSRAKDGDRFYAVYDPGVDPDALSGIIDVATRDTSPAPALAPAAGQEVSETALREVAVVIATAPGADTARLAPTPRVLEAEHTAAYVRIAKQYYNAAFLLSLQGNNRAADTTLKHFVATVAKIPKPNQIELVAELVDRADIAHNVELVTVLEKILDGIVEDAHEPHSANEPATLESQPNTPAADDVQHSVNATTISAARIIEECDRPWAMTSESLYGMFAADWDKEAEAVPDFILNTDTEELAKRLAHSVGVDPESKDFIAACRSVLLLQHRPMSSPWFETSGGRLRSDIQYSLSAKGQMFVRFLRAVRDSRSTDKARELSKIAERTLEKIDMVLAKD